MNHPEWIEFFEKLAAVLFTGTGTFLAMRVYYDKRHTETMERYAISRQKEYASERDFQHLKNNQEQMKEALKLLDDEVSALRENSKEIKGMLTVAFGKSGDSGFFGREGKH